MDEKEDLIIFSNGPGEVSTWVKPVIEAVRKRTDLAARYRTTLIMHPCQFGSGNEHRVAGDFEGVDKTITPGQYVKIILFGARAYGFSRRGIVFSLGGDLMHPVLFQKRIRGKYTLYAYSHNTGHERHYERLFVRNGYVRDSYLKRGVRPDRVVIVGDLVHSSLACLRDRDEVRKEIGVSGREKMVIFMPGSRDFEVTYMLPVFLRVMDGLTSRLSNTRVFILKSSYITYELIERGLEMGGRIREAESLPGKLKRNDDGGWEIEYVGGKRVRILEGGLEYWGKGVDFAVTLPGTNTIQLAYRKIPELVVAALNKPEVIPVEGLFGLMKWVPIIGKPVLKRAVLRYAKKFPFAALPNIYTGQEVVPELFGVFQTDDITRRLVDILEKGEEKEIKKRLSQFVPTRDPARLIVNAVWGEKQTGKD